MIKKISSELMIRAEVISKGKMSITEVKEEVAKMHEIQPDAIELLQAYHSISSNEGDKNGVMLRAYRYKEYEPTKEQKIKDSIQKEIDTLEEMLNEVDEKKNEAVKLTIQNLKEIKERIDIESLPFNNEDGEHEEEE